MNIQTLLWFSNLRNCGQAAHTDMLMFSYLNLTNTEWIFSQNIHSQIVSNSSFHGRMKLLFLLQNIAQMIYLKSCSHRFK